jgi:hypothetical protein
MGRRALRTIASLFALAAAGCGVLSPEEQLLTDFFEASRLHDLTIVARMASVTFNPRTQGVVDEFEIEEVMEAEGGAVEIVTVAAAVRGPDGERSQRILRFTLQRRDGRWFITGLEEDRP